MKKLLVKITLMIIALLTIVMPCSSASASSHMEQSYLAYYKFLEDELASMGKPLVNEYFDDPLASYEEYEKKHGVDIAFDLSGDWHNDKINYVYLKDITGDGIAELIYSKAVVATDKYGDMSRSLARIYTYKDGQLTRMGQTDSWSQKVGVSEYTGGPVFAAYYPEGFIGYSDDIYYCKGTGGEIRLCEGEPAERWGEHTVQYYKYSDGIMTKAEKLHSVYVEWYKSHDLRGKYGYFINDEHATEEQYINKIQQLQGAECFKLEPNDYNNAMWECGEVSKHLRFPSDWATANVNTAISKNYVPRSIQGNYTYPITRKEFCELATQYYETITGKEISARAKFNDTDNPSIEKMGGLGVINGVGGGNFAPNDELTREQAAVILANLASAMGNPLEENAPIFNDNSVISSWALQKVGAVQSSGIMSGVGNGNFAPSDKYTIEQSIVTILRLEDVQPLIKSMSFAEPNVELYTDMTVNILPQFEKMDTANMKLKWTSSNPYVATVNESSGEINTLTGGKTIISVEAVGGATAKFELNVIQTNGPIWAKLPFEVKCYSEDEPGLNVGSITVTKIEESYISGCYKVVGYISEIAEEYVFETTIPWKIEDYYGNVVETGEESIYSLHGKDINDEISFTIISICTEADEKYILKFEK